MLHSLPRKFISKPLRFPDILWGHLNETLGRNASWSCLLTDKYFVYPVFKCSTFVTPENIRKTEAENGLKANVISCSENYPYNIKSENFQ